MLTTSRCALALAAALSCAGLSLAAPPANPVGELLFKAREADGMKRLQAERVVGFDGGKRGNTDFVFAEIDVETDGVETEFLECKKSGSWEGERATIGFGGLLVKVESATGRGQEEPKPEDILKGKVEGNVLVMTKKGEELGRTELPEHAVLTFPQALFVIAPYYDLLPEGGLEFQAIMNGRLGPKLKISRGEAGEGFQKVIIGGEDRPGGIEVHVSTAAETQGRLLRIAIGDDVSERLTMEELEKRLKAMSEKGKQDGGSSGEGAPARQGGSPDAAVQALIKAARAGDMKAVGACFSAKAPREFQSLRDGTCPPERFKQFCDMFKDAKIGAVAEKGDQAEVKVQLGSRAETLNMIREDGTWRVLDF